MVVERVNIFRVLFVCFDFLMFGYSVESNQLNYINL